LVSGFVFVRFFFSFLFLLSVLCFFFLFV